MRSWKRFVLRQLGITQLHDGQENLRHGQEELRRDVERLSYLLSKDNSGFASSPNTWIDLENRLRELFADKSPNEIRDLVVKLVEAKKRGCLLLLDYPPSYEYRPRWGYAQPPHAGLAEMFDRDISVQREMLAQIVLLKPWFDQIAVQFDQARPGEPGWMGGPMNAIDTATLYAFLVKHRPETYVEIGSGVTTLFAARAKRDHQLPTRIVSIDPNPRAEVDSQCDEVVRKPLESYNLSLFAQLQPGDIVFMDGSHRTFMNSDVTVFMLDVMPKLKPGVIIHFHDIVLPYDYPEFFADWYWNEQYILGAYLLGAAEKVRILMPTGHFFAKQESRSVLAPALADWKGPKDVWMTGGSLWFTHSR